MEQRTVLIRTVARPVLLTLLGILLSRRSVEYNGDTARHVVVIMVVVGTIVCQMGNELVAHLEIKRFATFLEAHTDVRSFPSLAFYSQDKVP